MAKKYYDSGETAELLGVSQDEVKQMVQRQELHGYRDGADWKFKVEDIERTESAAQYRATIKTLRIDAPAAFTLNSLLAYAIGIKDAPQFGLKSMLSTLAREKPFGTVLIAVGKRGLPEDLKIIPLSLWARDSNRKESEVEDSLKSDGYLLMTPEQFAELLDKVESGILDGSYSLPVGIDRLSLLTT